MGKTRGVHETTPEIRNRMVGMYEAGLGLREIAAALNCSQRTVKRWLNRFDKEGTVETRDRCGRKRATTHEQDEAIVRLATQVPIRAAKAVLPALGLNCSVDTVRDRLHKAGFHNWNPPKKHIQKISVKETDGVKIEEPVWRPTGTTQLGKKKPPKETTKSKTNKSIKKKKTVSEKNKPKETFDDNEILSVGTNNVEHDVQPNFSFSSSLQNEQPQVQSHHHEHQPQPQIDDIPSMKFIPVHQTNHPMINCNQNEYVHSLNLMPQSQPTYHHHPGLNISQNWSFDPLQSSHYLPPNQQPIIHHEQNPLSIHQDVQIHHQTSFTQHLQDQINSSISMNHHIQNKIDTFHVEQHQELSELSPEKMSESQDDIINVCSDVCSNSSSSFNETSQNLIDENVSENTRSTRNNKKKTDQSKKKKGGKIKGTLETSVEIRNHMIGMAEAGLSTLSIALSINRSERTVKRWLDRWRKEGNVQTKERKGRKRITTKEQDEAIIAMASQQPLTAAKHVAPALGIKCSVDTIRERLHKAGFHSWKLGKKQGEGNAIHTVQVWQPSGNRSTKNKISDRKKKSSNKKRNQSSSQNNLENSKKQNKKASPENSIETPLESSPKETHLHYHDPPRDETICGIEPSYSLANPPIIPVQPQHNTHNLQLTSICSQPTPQMAMHQRPDCRLAFTSTYPQIPAQTNANISYPSCMMANTSHIGHIEQSDPMNFEPYVWSF